MHRSCRSRFEMTRIPPLNGNFEMEGEEAVCQWKQNSLKACVSGPTHCSPVNFASFPCDFLLQSKSSVATAAQLMLFWYPRDGLEPLFQAVADLPPFSQGFLLLCLKTRKSPASHTARHSESVQVKCSKQPSIYGWELQRRSSRSPFKPTGAGDHGGACVCEERERERCLAKKAVVVHLPSTAEGHPSTAADWLIWRESKWDE